MSAAEHTVEWLSKGVIDRPWLAEPLFPGRLGSTWISVDPQGVSSHRAFLFGRGARSKRYLHDAFNMHEDAFYLGFASALLGPAGFENSH